MSGMSRKSILEVTNEDDKSFIRARRAYCDWLKSPSGKMKKAIIFAQQKGRCATCGKNLVLRYFDIKGEYEPNLATIDHIIPLRVSLKHNPEDDYQILCPRCNLGKAITIDKVTHQPMQEAVKGR